MKRAFTLVELLVVIAIISILMALSLPVLRRVREQGAETACRSNLRQMTTILKTYCNDHDGLFPNPFYIYHSEASFEDDWKYLYPGACRWHDARINSDSPLLCRDHPEFRGSLVPYLGNLRILRCRTGTRANLERGCNNTEPCWDMNRQEIPVVPQYTYTMNSYLHMTIRTGGAGAGAPENGLDLSTIREIPVYRETQITRSPSEVFAFGEENSWAVNTTGSQPGAGPKREWAASYDLSGHGATEGNAILGRLGALCLPGLEIQQSYGFTLWRSENDRVVDAKIAKSQGTYAGDAFATYHSPDGGDLNTGHSYVSMLDGHVQKVTVSDQLRRSREDPNVPSSRLGPGGNLHLAWPLDIPPLGGWENQ
jgi:prepilin-type N-terminal cleavage/methylation domain-containing protein